MGVTCYFYYLGGKVAAFEGISFSSREAASCFSLCWCDVCEEAVGKVVVCPLNTSPWTELIEDYGGEYAMPLPADNPSSAAVWTQNEECISWRDSPHGVAETERQHCLITGPTNSTQSWWNTETGAEHWTEVLGVFDWGWVGEGMPNCCPPPNCGKQEQWDFV